MTVQLLIQALRNVEGDATVIQAEWLSDQPVCEAVDKVLELADGELITSTGQCNFAAHKELAAAGFPVTCGERDSFGWLTGVIHTSKGSICYG